jgi:hypothetical protein
LRTSLYNFMMANCLDWPVHDWFDFKTPKTKLPFNLIQKHIAETTGNDSDKLKYKIIWLGNPPEFIPQGKNTKVEIESGNGKLSTKMDTTSAQFIKKQLLKTLTSPKSLLTLNELLEHYTQETSFPKELLLYSETWKSLRASGLLLIRF